jgi:hypothetical protein
MKYSRGENQSAAVCSFTLKYDAITILVHLEKTPRSCAKPYLDHNEFAYKHALSRLMKRISKLYFALFLVLTVRVSACTIFVLTDTNRTLFCNNEDWEEPNTRIWFVPGSDKHYGGVYVGFDNDYAQGGMNTEGLAFDWVAGYTERWEPDPKIALVWGNSGQQALENCATVEQAIAFFRKHQDRQFYRAKILMADRTGASVIIGGKDGKLQVESSRQCRGFGFGQGTLDKMLTATTEPTVAKGEKILRASLQKGQYATKYFNIFDLKSDDIFLFPAPDQDDVVKFNLAGELKKGGHYYDMPQIHDQLKQPLRPLLDNMQRLRLDKYKAIPDTEPGVTAHIRNMLRNALEADLRAEDFTAELWKRESPNQKETQAVLQAFGSLISLALVDRGTEGANRTYRYRFEFEKNTVLQRFIFDEQNKLVEANTEEIL